MKKGRKEVRGDESRGGGIGGAKKEDGKSVRNRRIR